MCSKAADSNGLQRVWEAGNMLNKQSRKSRQETVLQSVDERGAKNPITLRKKSLLLNVTPSCGFGRLTERGVIFGVSNVRNLYRACLFRAADLLQGEDF
jgi:hypothetical protein